MRHTLRISVLKEPAAEGIVSCRNVSVRERFLRFLFGEKQRLTIIVPGGSVLELAVSEVMEETYIGNKSIKHKSPEAMTDWRQGIFIIP